MAIPSTFPIFEVDQVLTSKHLNDLFNYLDQQSRLTRIKLTGSGIVCGFELTFSQDFIHVSKGCGLTSQGYLVMGCDNDYTHYKPFASQPLPDDLQLILQCDATTDISKSGISFYGNYGNAVLELITDTEYGRLDATEQQTATPVSPAVKTFLDGYAVVLFLRAAKSDLKNCDTNDCNDKGSRMDFVTETLLVQKSLLDRLNSRSKPASESLLHHVELRRYNVPVRDLKSAEDVLAAFLKLVDDSDGVLTRLCNDLVYCWEQYHGLLKDEKINPFNNLLADLKKTLDNIVQKQPILIQYFYDFTDDLIKAFYEFKHKVFEVAGECCGDEMGFPFHLMLGEATLNTSLDIRSGYRQYFIHSPLFDVQNEKAGEIRCLFTRMRLMVQEFVFNGRHEAEYADLTNFDNKLIRITPSRYEHADLSDRCIPYYYKANDPGNELFRFWNYDKARRGSSRFNLGYNAFLYNSADNVRNPLMYDIEWFNFLRIEGHIGKQLTDAVSQLKGIQQDFNLPFDIVALSADFIGAILKGKEPQCVIQDLESEYRVLIAEFICKMHDSLCAASGHAFPPNREVVLKTERVAGEAPAQTMYEPENMVIADISISSLVNEYHANKGYVKGDILKRICRPVRGSAGSVYLASVNRNKGVFINPVNVIMDDADSQNNHNLFEYIDSFESMFSILLSHELSSLNPADFSAVHRRYTNLNVLVRSNMILHTCMVERLEALKNEYLRRVAQYRLAKNFGYYFKTHGGLEHKAGVPKGGTFILVYHEERNNRVIDLRSLFVNKDLHTILMTRFQALFNPDITANDLEFNTKLMQVATLYRDPELYMRFKDIMAQCLTDCIDMPPDKRRRIREMIDAPPPKQHFALREGTVIADFYVPYICCSDCPPVAYILPDRPQEPTVNPTITIDKNLFCSDEQSPIPIIVKPGGGVVSGPGVCKQNDLSYGFIAAAAGPGVHILTYDVAGKTATVQVEVIAMPVAKITATDQEVHAGDHLAFDSALSGNVVAGVTIYKWDLTVNSAPVQAPGNLPAFSYTVGENDREIVVNLTLSNGECTSVADTVTVKVVERIIPEKIRIVTCVSDEKITLEPNNKLAMANLDTDAMIIDKIKLSVDLPATLESDIKSGLSENFIHYTIPGGRPREVTLVVQSANADFLMQISEDLGPKKKRIDTHLRLEAKNKNANSYGWTVKQGNITVTSQLKEFTIDFNANTFSAGPTIAIVLQMINENNQCNKGASFLLTDSVYNKMKNNPVPFDNHFTA